VEREWQNSNALTEFTKWDLRFTNPTTSHARRVNGMLKIKKSGPDVGSCFGSFPMSLLVLDATPAKLTPCLIVWRNNPCPVRIHRGSKRLICPLAQTRRLNFLISFFADLW